MRNVVIRCKYCSEPHYEAEVERCRNNLRNKLNSALAKVKILQNVVLEEREKHESYKHW